MPFVIVPPETMIPCPIVEPLFLFRISPVRVPLTSTLPVILFWFQILPPSLPFSPTIMFPLTVPIYPLLIALPRPFILIVPSTVISPVIEAGPLLSWTFNMPPFKVAFSPTFIPPLIVL